MKNPLILIMLAALFSYTHLRAHETLRYLVCRLLLEKKKKKKKQKKKKKNKKKKKKNEVSSHKHNVID